MMSFMKFKDIPEDSDDSDDSKSLSIYVITPPVTDNISEVHHQTTEQQQVVNVLDRISFP